MQWQPFRVEVTHDLIDQGCDEPNNCPVALAFMTAGCATAHAHYSGVEFSLYDSPFETDMPEYLSNWISRFDAWYGDPDAEPKPQPTAFTVHPTPKRNDFHYRAVIVF